VALMELGYKFPQVINAALVSPRAQPAFQNQPFRALPYFNVNMDGKTYPIFHQDKKNDWAKWLSTSNQSHNKRPSNAVLKIIMMTMDEWPMIRSWVLYHGEIIGFENLYILDSSGHPSCISFLRYARDTLGANVIFSNANLNELENVMTDIGEALSGSADFIMKMDTDEYLTVYDKSTNMMKTSVRSYLADFASNPTHPLHEDNLVVGYFQNSIPNKEVCAKNIYATPENFAVGAVMTGTSPKFVFDPFKIFHSSRKSYKAVFDARKIFLSKHGGTHINLGGHGESFGKPSNFGVLHFHSRCVEIEVENCKRVLERHDYIKPTDSNSEANTKLAGLLGWNVGNSCNLRSDAKHNKGVDSWHKAVFYLKWLDCPEKVKQLYDSADSKKLLHFSSDASVGTLNKDFIDVMKTSQMKYEF